METRSPRKLPRRSISTSQLKAQKSSDLSVIIAIEGDVRRAEEKLESERQRLSQAVIKWLETYGEKVRRIDRDHDEEYEIPHYGSALAVENGVVQLFVRRLRYRDGTARTIGTIRRISTE